MWPRTLSWQGQVFYGMMIPNDTHNPHYEINKCKNIKEHSGLKWCDILCTNQLDRFCEKNKLSDNLPSRLRGCFDVRFASESSTEITQCFLLSRCTSAVVEYYVFLPSRTEHDCRVTRDWRKISMFESRAHCVSTGSIEWFIRTDSQGDLTRFTV